MLRASGFEVIAVIDQHIGISDTEVLELSKSFQALLLTEDSDFGEWIFAHQEKVLGVIFLRYKASELVSISDSLSKVLIKYEKSLYGKFVVITVHKIRMRNI